MSKGHALLPHHSVKRELQEWLYWMFKTDCFMLWKTATSDSVWFLCDYSILLVWPIITDHIIIRPTFYITCPCTVHGADLTHISLLVIQSLYSRVCDKYKLELEHAAFYITLVNSCNSGVFNLLQDEKSLVDKRMKQDPLHILSNVWNIIHITPY